ncbi:3-hydroxybutyryl-CoA dehydrogenase, partial [Candidatus Bathyarchaeota archaeon]|nr:3-hydroxyacyl-CoA dehydrogenase family protein [Candidatus Bathyarchaeota archaeon]NIR14036.1 3-hydroxyacyl-CoA dehydrogenase family protein [Desulfobacterales bacterium]NIU80663.1 3-hydroxybutyryl-CoA dehydrogenase [Candidatus Bathyarchaeota archaeon]NIV67284.1 3-hydroxybutyryl-CoA dehydrogenase [Candidatus Bathyarchaeota archaeon]NIW15849.1 3-hydroxybutyryl-CoA dehydrogenase [Candidatus Bathyarchaeota archaeon]
MEIEKVAVIGAGLMGHGIAQVAAQVAGYRVTLRDIKQEFLDQGMKMIKGSLQKFVEKDRISQKEMEETLSRIHPLLDLEEAVQDADLIVEAVPEKAELKKSVLEEVDQVAQEDALMASNTSSISITELASATERPERFCGMHFFNPPQLMKLVEIIRGAKTSDATINSIVEISQKMGKETVVVQKDAPGFIVNRILIPALNEAMYLVWEGIAEPEDIDKAIRLGLNWPMGPLKLLDYLGLDTTLSIAEVLRKDLDPKYRACPLLRQMVRADLLGRKT